jgi:hypothetical protein
MSYRRVMAMDERNVWGASANGCLKLQTYFELCQCGGDCKNQSCEDDGSHDSGPTVVEVCLKIFEAEPEDKEVVEVGDEVGE